MLGSKVPSPLPVCSLNYKLKEKNNLLEVLSELHKSIMILYVIISVKFKPDYTHMHELVEM